MSSRERRGSQGSEPYSPYDFSTEHDVPEIQAATPKPAQTQEGEELMEEVVPPSQEQTALPADRLKSFKARLFQVFQESHAQSVGMTSLLPAINQEQEVPFSEEEVRAALSRMQDDNQVMLADDIVFLI